MRVEDVAGHRTGRYCSPRHTMPFKSRSESSNCVTTTLRTLSARPCYRCVARHGHEAGLCANLPQRQPHRRHHVHLPLLTVAAVQRGRSQQPRGRDKQTSPPPCQ